MSFDERIEKLTERHEALAESVELLVRSAREEGAKIGLQIQQLLRHSERDGENIRALARIAEMHEHRITGLEGPA